MYCFFIVSKYSKCAFKQSYIIVEQLSDEYINKRSEDNPHLFWLVQQIKRCLSDDLCADIQSEHDLIRNILQKYSQYWKEVMTREDVSHENTQWTNQGPPAIFEPTDTIDNGTGKNPQPLTNRTGKNMPPLPSWYFTSMDETQLSQWRLTLARHTDMVLWQFSKYFDQSFDEIFQGRIDKLFFTLLLWIHDIAKPQARKDKNTKEHNRYNKPIIQGILEKLWYPQDLVNLWIALICHNPLGKCIRNEKSIEETCNLIQSWYEIYQWAVTATDYFNLLIVYFLCDASAYTRDAQAQNFPFRFLEHLFNFHNNTVSMKLPYQQKIQKLSQARKKSNNYMKSWEKSASDNLRRNTTPPQEDLLFSH